MIYKTEQVTINPTNNWTGERETIHIDKYVQLHRDCVFCASTMQYIFLNIMSPMIIFYISAMLFFDIFFYFRKKNRSRWNGNIIGFWGFINAFTKIMDALESNFKTTSIKTMSAKNIYDSVKTDKQVVTKNVKNDYLEKKKIPISINFNIDARIIPLVVLTAIIAFGFIQNTTKDNPILPKIYNKFWWTPRNLP